MSNSRLDGVRKGTRIPDLLLRRQSLYPTELYGPIVLKPAISRGLTPYIVFLGLDNILSEEGIIHGLLLSIYCRVRSHFSRRIELTTELLFFSRLVLALFLRVYLKTVNAPGQRAFSRCAASFFLEIRQYSCEKMSCSARKFLAAGHITSFQIHPKNF